MSLKYFLCLISGIIVASTAIATPPVEVLSSCKKSKAVTSAVIFTKMISPGGAAAESGCEDHYERTEGNFTYGAIVCDKPYLIINKTRLDLTQAENMSVNRAVKPGPIYITSSWSKIEFDNQAYLCVSEPLGQSGIGASKEQYYIIENAFNKNTPIVYFYFFDQDVMPITTPS